MTRLLHLNASFNIAILPINTYALFRINFGGAYISTPYDVSVYTERSTARTCECASYLHRPGNHRLKQRAIHLV